MSCYFEPLATLVLLNLWSESFYYTHISQTQILSGSCLWFCNFLLYFEVLPSCVLCCFFVLPFFCIHLFLVCVYSLCAPSCFYQFVLCDSPVCSPVTRRVSSWCFMFFVSRVIPWVFPDLIHAFCGTLMELSCHYLVFWGFKASCWFLYLWIWYYSACITKLASCLSSCLHPCVFLHLGLNLFLTQHSKYIHIVISHHGY